MANESAPLSARLEAGIPKRQAEDKNVRQCNHYAIRHANFEVENNWGEPEHDEDAIPRQVQNDVIDSSLATTPAMEQCKQSCL